MISITVIVTKKTVQCQLQRMFRIIKEPEKPKKEEPKFNEDLEIISQMNQEFAISLDLNETLKTALKVIVKRINAQAALAVDGNCDIVITCPIILAYSSLS